MCIRDRYTPISTNALKGKFELLVKVYDGGLSQYMDEMKLGDTLNFKHIDFNVKTQYPFGCARICMIAGGTGVAPMLQALHAILGTGGDETQVTLLYGSRTEQDILGLDILTEWEKQSNQQLKVVHVLSEESAGWAGRTGFIGKDLIVENLGDRACSDTQVWVCGPPPMYDALCGPRSEVALEGVLADLGYQPEQVYKF
eukprot:TRINITY_DN43824_c0_g1_i3.p1 TRINITY_DN43824_c0_g1~~TRINITY_DN43824_c0_g1_i3.p1  ORF type:complete len:199 (+),score=49.04 TRINITY_DN43824_c0_g1_i3:143-739(+)